ncbi:MAG: DNA-methyltransferase [Acidimicrobiales bacterium]
MMAAPATSSPGPAPSTTLTWYTGDAAAVLATMPAASVDLVVTSPPFLGLRSYLTDPDPHEIGTEGTPADYLHHLLVCLDQCRRVLTPTGSLVIEIGDSYAGSGGAGGDYRPGGKHAADRPFDGTAAQGRSDTRRRRNRQADAAMLQPGKSWATRPGWPAAKSRIAIPELLTVALAHGLNPLTGDRHPSWLVRDTIAWCRRSAMPGAKSDRTTPAHSTLIVACTSPRRFWDGTKLPADLARDWWVIESTGLPVGARRQGVHHPAVMPEALARPLIETMCPPEACADCATPSPPDGNLCSRCGSPHRRAGIVLDPCAGSGTTMAVAHGLGRSAIGIDLDPAGEGRVRTRLGLWGSQLLAG